MGQRAPDNGEAGASPQSSAGELAEPHDEGMVPHGFIHGSETVPPDDSYYVNDYPYSHPAQIDYICLATICLLVLLHTVFKRVLARQYRFPMLERISGRVGRARPLLVALVFFVILEGVLAIAVHFQPISRYRPDAVSLWRIHAEFTHIGKEEPTVNSMGLANDELPLAKPEGVVRILSLGDSRTLGGSGTKPVNAYPRVLEGIIRQANRDTNVEVIQGALSGYSSYQGLLLFKNVGLKYEPDVVTVALGYQDKERAWAADADHMSDSYLLSLVRGLLYKSNLFLVLRKNLLNVTKFRRNKQANVRWKRRVSVDDFKRNLSTIIEVARASNMQVILIEMPFNPYTGQPPKRYPKYREAQHQIALREAEAGDVHYLDMHDYFWQNPQGSGTNVRSTAVLQQRSREYFVDDCHMKANGHRILAQALVDLIQREKILERVLER